VPFVSQPINQLSFRAKQADFLFRFRSCAPSASRMLLRDENVGLRSRGISLRISQGSDRSGIWASLGTGEVCCIV